MPVVTRLAPVPSRSTEQAIWVSRVRRSTAAVRPPRPVAAGGADAPSASSTRSLSAGVPSVSRMWLGRASKVRTTIAAPSSRPTVAVFGSPRSQNRKFVRESGICQPRPRKASVIRVRSPTVSATLRNISSGSASASWASAAECEEMLPGGRIASSLAASAGGARM